jgi:hypothetical protein
MVDHNNEFGVFPTEEVEFFGGDDIVTVQTPAWMGAIQVATFMLSVCSITFGFYILLISISI